MQIRYAAAAHWLLVPRSMIWNRKQKVAPAELAEALLSEFVAAAAANAAKHLSLDPAALSRFNQKARSYGIASVLLALAREEQSNPRFSAVRAELERRVFPATATTTGVAMLDVVKSAMKDLSELLFPVAQPKEMSWARNWLLDIGVNESNPATLALLATYWLDYYITASKALQSFKVV